jgi:hypothetical protein
MDCETNLPRFKGISDNIIRIENNYDDKSLKLYYRCDPKRYIMNIIKHLNETECKNFKFNQYSIRKENENYVVILNYVVPKAVFSK